MAITQVRRASHLPADTTLQTYISGFSRYTEATHCRTTSRPSAFTDLVSTITGPSYLNNKITACALPPRAHRAMRASNDRTTSPEHAAHGPPCSTDTSPRRLPMTQLGDLTPPLITAPNAQAVPPNDPDHVRLGNIVRLRRLLLDSIQRRLDLQLNISHLIRSQIHALTSPRTQLRREPLQQPAAHPSDPNFQAASPRQDASADDPTDTATTCHLPADNQVLVASDRSPPVSRLMSPGLARTQTALPPAPHGPGPLHSYEYHTSQDTCYAHRLQPLFHPRQTNDLDATTVLLQTPPLPLHHQLSSAPASTGPRHNQVRPLARHCSRPNP